MNYKMFQETIVREVGYLSERGTDVILCPLNKMNGVTKVGITIKRSDRVLSPVVCLEEYFEMYQDGAEIDELAKLITDQCCIVTDFDMLPKNFFTSFDGVKGRLFCRLINYEQNKELLKQVPHMVWLDLAIVYYYEVEKSLLPSATILVRNDHLTMWKVSETDVLRVAWDNTIRTYPATFERLYDVLKGCGVEVMDDMDIPTLYILSNENKTFGAITICYPDVLACIAKQLDSNYYIIPSSIHECLIVAECSDHDFDSLSDMVKSINEYHVAEQDVLADHVYYYDRETAVICPTADK